MFDHTSNPPPLSDCNNTYNCKNKLFFHKFGLSSSDYLGNQFKSIQSIHSIATSIDRYNNKNDNPLNYDLFNNSIIDLLKIDCDGCEGYSLVDNSFAIEFLKNYVIQLNIEIHINMGNMTSLTDAFNIWNVLTKAGFYTFHKEPNIQYSQTYDPKGIFAIEYSLLNSKYVVKHH